MVRTFLLTNLERTEAGFRWRVNLGLYFYFFEHRIKKIKLCKKDAINKRLDRVGEIPFGEDTSSPVRTLFIGGNKSKYIPESSFGKIHSHFPNSQIKHIDGGHWIHYENPKQFLATVEAFRKEK